MFKILFSWLDKTKKFWMIVTSLASVIGMASALYGVAHSQLFTLTNIEIVDYPKNPALTEEEVLKIMNVPVDAISLFSLNLSEIKEKIESHPWIKEVTLNKRFPQTIQVSVKFREPLAIYQKKNGELIYLDQEGNPFAKTKLESLNKVPIVYGFNDSEYLSAIKKICEFLKTWNSIAASSPIRLASLEWHADGGFRALGIFTQDGYTQRFMMDFGDLSNEKEFSEPFQRVLSVVNYLAKEKIPYRHIFADLGKKVVVKIPRHS